MRRSQKAFVTWQRIKLFVAPWIPFATIRADRKIEGVDPGIASVTGQITARFADTMLLTRAQNGAATAFTSAFTVDANRSLTFTLREVYLALAKTPIEGPAGGVLDPHGVACPTISQSERRISLLCRLSVTEDGTIMFDTGSGSMGLRRVWAVLSLSLLALPAVANEADDALVALLQRHGFTGRIEERLQENLGRVLDPKLADLGRLVFFDRGLGVHQSNSCAGCHSPTRGFGDTQPIAIGVSANNIVGPSRNGARNQRRSPMLVNVGAYPALMWNGRFSSVSGNPFDNSQGFSFPNPESQSFFPARDSRYPNLLTAQAHIPFTEMPEMAGFGGLNTSAPRAAVVFSLFNSQRFPGVRATSENLARLQARSPTSDRPIDDNSDFRQFDDVPATEPHRFIPEPYPEVSSRNGPIRHRVIQIINANAEYRTLFGQIFPSVDTGNPIEFYMIGQALAEFQISLTFANAPLDRYARGDRTALTDQQKRGATLFFGQAGCVSCHAVAGTSNEMFSDFRSHAAGVPALAPRFGVGTGNVPFRDREGVLTIQGRFDMGLFDITNIELDRFKFRTSPLRNVGLQSSFFHNGAFSRLEDAVWFHLDATARSASYDPVAAGVPEDLRTLGDQSIVLEHLAPQLRPGRIPQLSPADVNAIAAFLREGLLDPRARPEHLRSLIPAAVPSGLSVHVFE